MHSRFLTIISFQQIHNNGIDAQGCPGSCGFIALGTTREVVLKLLMSNIDKDNICKLIGQAIAIDFAIDKNSVKLNNETTLRLEELTNRRNEKEEERNKLIKKYKDQYPKLGNANEQYIIRFLSNSPISNKYSLIKELNDIKAAHASAYNEVNNFLKSKKVVSEYLNNNIGTEWIHANIAKAWAITANKTLRIWRPDRNRAHVMEDIFCIEELCNFSADDSDPIDLIQVGESHYERLRKELKPAPSIKILS